MTPPRALRPVSRAGDPRRRIAIANRHRRLRLDRRAVARVIHVLDAHFGSRSPRSRRGRTTRAAVGELSVVFLTDTALARLHAVFLDDPTATDVITFEGDPTLGIDGEICVSVDAAARHAGLRRVGTRPHSPVRRRAPAHRWRDFSEELTLYLIHGWLHLAGYDDSVPAKKRAMRRAEARALALLRKARCLPRFALRK